ncbi:GyrI-like domain-containing protein [Jeotgalibacillus haloalkalitolerans]|uniref:GyrI-like domain-containing protein n=1 Tax=Jeotgalibacillus haloalkalitolerans TaxID=3104292 RepID=A0ABU5KQP8_9BACL|nr:GyrI-like domain-containing protein [Jeotgalibacillus sp. HH7-29]MDZ5713413.1 GyrI-like domain-containing protein [Jeotgalibacillus sp. HH7-29]
MADFEIVRKSSFYFIGMKWTGTYEAAAHGDIFPVIEEARDRLLSMGIAQENSDFIGLSYQDRPGGFTYYFGTEAFRSTVFPSDMYRIIVPSHDYAVTEHKGQHAWKSYEKLMKWAVEQGLQVQQNGLDHIEVYDADYNPYKMSPTLKIGIPVKKR